MTKNERLAYARSLAIGWCRGNIPTGDQLAVLTPDEAEAVAISAGYNTDYEMHVAIRRGCRMYAQEDDQ